jgi:FAD-dependent oxidoreductase family protein
VEDVSFDIAVIGGSFAGCACALAAASTGAHVTLIEQSATFGGQATSQGVTRWDERGPQITPAAYGSTRTYQDLKRAIRRWYGDRGVLAAGVDVRTFNPGWHEPGHEFSADPAVVEEVLVGMLKHARIVPIIRRRAVSVHIDGGVMKSVTLDDGTVIEATIFVDATDLGDVLPLAGVTWNVGEEARSDTTEPEAPETADSGHVQPITVPVAVERSPDGKVCTIVPPDVDPRIIAAQAFGWNDGDIGGVFTPRPGFSETVFNYRQYIDHRNFSDRAYAADRSTLNVRSNDYQWDVIPTGDTHRDAGTVENARKVSLAYLHWLQTSVARDDDHGTGYPNLCIRKDAFPETGDGTAPQPYIRESRRLARPLTRVIAQDISRPNDGVARAPTNFVDSGGIGWYFADIHRITGPPGTPDRDVPNVGPFQIPLGALVQREVGNLLAGCKNIGTTHLTGAAYRVHPAEWAVGEAAGVLAAYCVGQGVSPPSAWAEPARITALQLRLLERGAPIFWWNDVSVDDGDVFVAANMLGVLGYMVDAKTLDFRPRADITSGERAAVEQRLGRQLTWPSFTKRGENAVWLSSHLTDDDRLRARSRNGEQP